MTTIDTSKASRELDIWLVEHILGWKRHDKCNECFVSPEHIYHKGILVFDDWENKECHPRMTTPDGERYWLCPCQDRKGTIEIPGFSASIVPSMSIVDKLTADGAEWDFRYDAVVKKWFAVLMAFGSTCPIGKADTLPLGICQALYKWKEGEK